MEECHIEPKNGWGLESLCHHISAFPTYRGDEQLKITCKILTLTTDKVVWDLYCKTNANVSDAKLDDQTNAKLDQNKTKLDEALDKVAAMENKLEKIQNFQTNNNNTTKKPPCPICFEDMSTNTKIAQCHNGHLLCWSCKEKMNSNDCPSCGLPVDGRAFGMESYLRSLFGFEK